MSLSCRCLRRSVLSVLFLLSGVCAAQQFLNVPEVEPTGGQVASFLTGIFQSPPNLTDILYINSPVSSGTSSSITVGELLNKQGFNNFGENRIVFTKVSNVVAALADFDGDGNIDYAFALTPTVPGGTNLCVYYGTGTTVAGGLQGVSSYNGGSSANAYPPTGGKSGCLTFPVAGTNPPNFSTIAAFPIAPGAPPQLVIEDSANNFLYVLANNGNPGSNGALPGFSLIHTYAIPPSDGAGPIYAGDLNHDGNTDFILNGQKGHSASVYFGVGGGGFLVPTPQNRYIFDRNIHSMLLQDMDGDKQPDMVVEGDNGVIEIFHGNADGTFATTSEGGTPTGVDGFSGHGGHLAAINPITLDILTTTPIGLSVLQAGSGTLNYVLKSIYNIGPGRTSYALADFFATNNLDVAVDSPEGVAIIPGSPDGSFQTSNAYSTLAPALSEVTGVFTNVNLSKRIFDVVVGTGAIQGQLLSGNGAGAFTAAVSPTDPGAGQIPNPPPANFWSNLLTGDFNGDGNLDIAYALTGLPLPAQGSGAGPGLYVQYGNGNGTFQNPTLVSPSSVGAPAANTFYGESTSGFFDSDSMTDIVSIDAGYDDTLLGGNSSFKLGLNATAGNTAFNQVAVGLFQENRAGQQDLVFQQGANFIPYRNAQDGTGKNFTPMPALIGALPPLYATSLSLIDVDSDGNDDVVVVYYNTQTNPVGAGPVSPSQLYVWYGNGDGTFSPSPQVLNLTRNYYLATITDLNRDGLPDLILSDGSLVSILYNLGSRTFGNEQHFLAGQGINALGLGDVNRDGEPDLIVANGGITLSNPIVLGGKTASSLTLALNPDVNTGGITVLLNSVTTKPVTGNLVATPEPSNVGAKFILLATLTSSPGVALPTGIVTFYIDGLQVGTGNLGPVPGSTTTASASFAISAGNTYSAGGHSLTAIYSGDVVNSPLTFPGTHAIAGATTPPMIESLAATPEPSNVGANFVLIATLTPSPGVAAPTGVVTFFIDGVQVGTGNLGPVPGINSSSANFPIPTGNVYPVGSHALSANYSGDAANSPITFAGTHLITGTTTTTLALCVGPSAQCPSNGFVSPPYVAMLAMIYGQTYNGTATVTASDGGALPGSTLFYDAYNGAAPLLLCTLQTQAGGTCPPSVGIGAAVGTHVFTAVYAPGPNDTHTGSTSLPVTIVVTQDTLTATLAGQPNPSPAGQPVTFTATFTGTNAPPPGTPGSLGTYLPATGQVVFTYGGAVLGTGTLAANSGGASSSASITTSSLPVGTDTVTASYAASLDFGSISATTTETITPSLAGSFTLAVAPTPVSVGVGYAALLKVTVTPQNGFSQAVNLTCINLPSESSCYFDTPQIASGSGITQVVVFTTAPHSCGSAQPYFYGSNRAASFALPALAGLAVLFLPGRRRWLRVLIALVAIAAVTQITGCGNCTDLGTRPATYTFQVTGTSATTSEVQSQPVTITVTL